ncbi:MAG: glutamate--tRNA ligase, partial [Bacteroidota bacterium]|nr:glutamate--tRNA ligase [Bacteroidota bacterium]
ASYFFVAPEQYNEQVASKKWNSGAAAVFEDFKNQLPSVTDFTADNVKALLMQILEQHGKKIGQVMQALRLAITGLEAGPDLMAIIEVIGPEETAARIDAAIAKLQPYAV